VDHQRGFWRVRMPVPIGGKGGEDCPAGMGTMPNRKVVATLMLLSSRLLLFTDNRNRCFYRAIVLLRHRCSRAFMFLLAREDANLPPLCEEGNCPLRQDEKAVSEANQEVNVHQHPKDPADKSGKAHKA
jgi:hypothetical protein